MLGHLMCISGPCCKHDFRKADAPRHDLVRLNMATQYVSDGLRQDSTHVRTD